jgi:hypothetical protein
VRRQLSYFSWAALSPAAGSICSSGLRSRRREP